MVAVGVPRAPRGPLRPTPRSQRRRQRRRSSARGAGSRRDRHRLRGRWRPHLPFASSSLALALLVIATSRPMATITTIRRVGDRRACDRRLEFDGREGRRALAASRSRRRRRAPSSRISLHVPIGVVAFGAAPVIVQRPTFDHAADLRRSATSPWGRHLDVGGHPQRPRCDRRQDAEDQHDALEQDNSGNINIGYFGGATIVLISDGENTSQANPVTIARVASTAGVRIQTLGVGTDGGTTVKIDGFSVATAADPQTLENVASVSNGSYHEASNLAVADDRSVDQPAFRRGVRAHRDLGAVRARRRRSSSCSGRVLSLRSSGRVM